MKIVSPFLGLARTRHWGAGHDIVGSAAGPAFESLALILVPAVQHDIVACAARATSALGGLFRAPSQGHFRDLLRYGNAEKAFKNKKLIGGGSYYLSLEAIKPFDFHDLLPFAGTYLTKPEFSTILLNAIVVILVMMVCIHS